ncbi:MAG: TIR domain-containing protein [Bryobacteraceae bacterium]
MGSSAKAFVSYSRTDSDFVLRLCRDLRAAGASIWLDKLDIRPGEEWDQEIERGLAECGRMLVVLSPESVASPNVLDEIGYALPKKRAIIPILYRDCEIPYRLNRLQYVDFRTGYDAGLRDLLSSLSGAKEEDSETIPIPVPDEGPRRWYWLAGAVVIASLLAWTVFDRRAVPPGPRPAPEMRKQQPVASDPPAPPTKNPAAKNPKPASKPSFRDLFRTTLTRYIAEAPSGFQKLGAKEFVKWTPSVSLPEAVSCSGSGYPRDPVIKCVLYRTDSEVEAANRFEDLIDLTQATMPEWEGHRLNLFTAFFSSSKTSSVVGLGARKVGDHYDVTISVRRGSEK